MFLSTSIGAAHAVAATSARMKQVFVPNVGIVAKTMAMAAAARRSHPLSPRTTSCVKKRMFASQSQQQQQQQQKVVAADVVIVGTGYAGLAAAIEASHHLQQSTMNDSSSTTISNNGNCNGKVVLLEKMTTPGGNSIMNAGQIAAVGSDAQHKAGIEDSTQLMMQDMCKAGVDLNHPLLLQKMCEESNDVVRWTQRELGITYRDRVTQLGGHSVPRTLSTLNASGRDIIDPLLDKVRSLSNVIDLRLNTAFESFVTLPKEDGCGCSSSSNSHVVEVHGARTYNTETHEHTTIVTRKGVILASGGFSADIQFRMIQNPSFDHKVGSTNQPGATAECIREALKLGAMSVQLSRIQLGPWTSPDEEGFGLAPFFCIGAGFPYGIIVDPVTGQRFVNELGNRYERSMAILKQIGHPVVCLTDSVGASHSLKKDLKTMEPAVKSFDTIKDMATNYGMDTHTLEETIQKYNGGVDTSEDEYGKPLRDDLLPIIEPPYYACRLWPKVHHTMGGLHINEHAQVMHVDGYPIQGLYAAGEVAGGIHGGDRLGSCATLDCLSFGRIAGRNVVLNAKEDIVAHLEYDDDMHSRSPHDDHAA